MIANGSSMMADFFEHASGRFGERVNGHKCRVIALVNDVHHLADFKPGDNAEKNLLLDAGFTSTSLINGHAATEDVCDGLSDLIGSFGYNGDRVVLLDPVKEKVERL